MAAKPVLTPKQKFVGDAGAIPYPALPKPPKIPEAIKGWFKENKEWRAAWDQYDLDMERWAKEQRNSGFA